MKFIKVLLVILLYSLTSYSQDCVDFWNIKTKPGFYSLIPEACHSMLVSNTEFLKVNFQMDEGRDYRITVRTDKLGDKAVYKIYTQDTDSLIFSNYDQTEDTAQVFEFEVRQTRLVYVIVTLSDFREDENSYSSGLKPKTNRYCIGIKVETMITRK